MGQVIELKKYRPDPQPMPQYAQRDAEIVNEYAGWVRLENARSTAGRVGILTNLAVMFLTYALTRDVLLALFLSISTGMAVRSYVLNQEMKI